ncbi:NAD(P)-binding protein [Aspergillus steynii IBT 23096]|uniref:NAD(P)-binding protein n=1 Tax=Aspergillus steynii IBT 23096 TaxID=1392250 RepID=A0A2I2GH83_9EURO|nr:NAD(P)-binding protein [Aspergillus steynii IBT 23096]PLB52197.1 NAD(P)-binding protein [Aspergillus steynii IBT 23096]
MVKITIAGGSGQVAKEVIDALLATKKHDITILTRNVSAPNGSSGITWRTVDYNDKSNLTEALRGTHTVLSFVQLLTDPEQKSQKNLIDAAIAAGVKRFAPSEYGSAGTVDMSWWAGKEIIREYLRTINRNEKYTLFQAGLFLDYLASPYKTAKHVEPLDTVFDFQHCRAILIDGHEDAIMTLTSVADLASVIARAVDYEGEWPEIRGIRGNRLNFEEIVKVGEDIRGRPFAVDKVKLGDLKTGVLNASWGLEKSHRAVSDEQAAELKKTVSIGILLSSVQGAWDVSEEFNRLFPNHQFDDMKEFLGRVWKA